MEVITEQIAKNHVHNHLIFLEVNDPSTLASYVLLKNFYRSLDYTVKESKDWRYLFIVKRTFLRHRKSNDGWTCHYCGKKMTKMSKLGGRSFDKSCVTVDHKNPAFKCSDKTDSSNFLESCYSCNNKKGSMSYETFINKL
jgi:5-methylcytosine-specific restriction endonuclease McrA